MSNITFNPWIGENYGKSEYGKLLIIGDSHYFNNDQPKNLADFTKNQIAELDVIASNFHNTIIKVFGHSQHSDFWKNIAFANAIQTPFTFANQNPTIQEKNIAESSFREYLDITKPQKVIIFSSRLWEHFFNKSVWGNHVGKIDERWNIRDLDYKNGICRAIGIYHPSARGFSNHNFPHVLKDLLNNY